MDYSRSTNSDNIVKVFLPEPWVVEKFLILLPSPRTFLMNIRSQQFVGNVANLLIQARKGPNMLETIMMRTVFSVNYVTLVDFIV